MIYDGVVVGGVYGISLTMYELVDNKKMSGEM